MEEEKGEVCAQYQGGDREWKIESFKGKCTNPIAISVIKPDHPAHVSSCTDPYVDPSELLTELDALMLSLT